MAPWESNELFPSKQEQLVNMSIKINNLIETSNLKDVAFQKNKKRMNEAKSTATIQIE